MSERVLRYLEGSFWLCLSPKRHAFGSLSARMTSKRPALGEDEIAMQLTVKLPASLFEKPQLQAKVEVASADAEPLVITADMAATVAAALSDQLGVKVSVSVPAPATAADAGE